MAYIGRDTDKISNVEVLDNITFDGSSSYTLQKGGSNFTPSSANTLLVSINGVVQAGNFTVSGSTIDFGTAVAGTSTCDFILHYGIGLITSVSDGTVTTAKLGDSAVTNAKVNASAAIDYSKLNLTGNIALADLSATGTKDATTFLRGDNTFAEAGGGKVLQVVSTEKSDTFSSSGTSFQDITGLTATITPSSTSSKILVLVNISSGADNGYKYGFRLLRSGTVINEGDSASSRKLVSIGLHSGSSISFESSSIVYLDSPNTTSSRQYDIQGSTEGSNFYVNRTYTDTDAASHMRATSNITLMEIGA